MGRAPYGALLAVGLICCACGGGVLLLPGVALWRLGRTLFWEEALATVETVSLREDADGILDVRAQYRYSWGGREYRGTQVDYLSPSNDQGHRRRFEALKSHSGTGRPVSAWVNPKDPSEAVLFRDFDTGLVMVGLFGLMFALPGAGFGLYGLVGFFRGEGPGTVAAPSGAFLPRIPAQKKAGGWVLVDTEDTWRSHGLIGAVALFWNGLTWVFVAIFGILIAQGEVPGGVAVFFVLFMTPFVGIGAFLAYKWFQTAWRTRRMPAGELWVSRWPVAPGDRVEARFRRPLRGVRGGEPLDALGGSLLLREIVKYRVGTDTRTAEENALEAPLDLRDAGIDAEGVHARFAVAIPGDAPPSFESGSNQLVWRVRLVMRPRGFPEDDSSFDLLVLPRRLA